MIVVDASVVCKWIVDEHDPSTIAARVLLNGYLDGKEEIIAPDILLYEIANIFVYKLGLSVEGARRAWKTFLTLDIPIYVPNKTFIEECLEFSWKHRVSVYDASYLVLAKTKQCHLITDDKKLIARVKLQFVRSIRS